jgi:hypothetical protein
VKSCDVRGRYRKWHMYDPLDRPGPDSSPKQGKSYPRFGFSKNTKVRPPFSFSPHTCLNSVYPCFFPLNPDFLLHSSDPLQACLLFEEFASQDRRMKPPAFLFKLSVSPLQTSKISKLALTSSFHQSPCRPTRLGLPTPYPSPPPQCATIS